MSSDFILFCVLAAGVGIGLLAVGLTIRSSRLSRDEEWARALGAAALRAGPRRPSARFAPSEPSSNGRHTSRFD